MFPASARSVHTFADPSHKHGEHLYSSYATNYLRPATDMTLPRIQGAATLLASAFAALQATPDSGAFQAPPVPVLAPVSIELRATTVTLLHGPGPEDDEVRPAGKYPLVSALRAATPGSDPVIGVFGELPGSGITIGGGDAGLKEYVVHWGAEPMRFTVIGMTEDARIREFGICQRMNDGRENGGVIDARFERLTIEARHSSCVSVPEGHGFGILRFYDCHFATGRENSTQGTFSGFGYKWGVRSQGRGRWDFRGCSFDPVLEHALYLDSPQGDSYFVDLEHRGSTRTAIQIVNRAFDNPGPSGFGTLLFERVRIVGPHGDGGSGITVAGHLGDLVLRDVSVVEDPEKKASHGAIAIWTDAEPRHGVHLHAADGRLFSSRTVTIESLQVDLPHSDRPHVAISGAESVLIRSFSVQGNQAAFAFDSPFGAPTINGRVLVDGEQRELEDARILNGRVVFDLPSPVSAYPGFRSAHKVLSGSRTLSDEEIDELWSLHR